MTHLNFQDYRDDELLSAYVDGELTEQERATVEARLRDDPAARELVAELRSVSASLQSLPTLTVDAGLKEAVFEQMESVELAGNRRWGWAALAMAAAIVLAAYLPNAQPNPQRVADANQQGRNRQGMALKLDAPADLAANDQLKTVQASMARFNWDDAKAAEALVNPDAASGSVRFDGTLQPLQILVPLLQSVGGQPRELYRVYLTPVDAGAGIDQFHQLLADQGVAMRFGLRIAHVAAKGAKPVLGNAELVLVEASPERIEQLLTACSADKAQWRSLHVVGRNNETLPPQSWHRLQSDASSADAVETLPESSTIRVLFILHPAATGATR